MKHFLSVIVLFVFVTSCVVENEEIDYTYSIEKIWWTHNIDGNEDGYDQYKRLNLNLHLAEEAVRTVHARIYYKNSKASSFSFYALSEEKQVTGTGSDNEFVIPIGTPNKNLPKGLYDFSIEIYEKDSERIEATNGSVDSLVLVNNKIEAPDNDNSFIISVWWENKFDFNQNDFNRHAKLVINPDIEQNSSGTVSKEIITKLSYRLKDDENYTLLKEFGKTTVTGTSLDDTLTHVIGKGNSEIGKTDFELDQGEYDFLVEIFDARTEQLITFADYLTAELKARKFETKREDSYSYSVLNPSWETASIIDNDQDQFSVFRKLVFNVNVDKEVERQIYAKIYLPKDSVTASDSSDFYLYDSTGTFTIFGSSSNNKISIDIGSKEPDSKRSLDSSSYDFLISVFDNKREIDTVETYVGFLTDSTVLFQQKFEKPEQDSLK